MTYRWRMILTFVLTGHWIAAWKWTTREWPMPVQISDELLRAWSVDAEAIVRNAFKDV